LNKATEAKEYFLKWKDVPDGVSEDAILFIQTSIDALRQMRGIDCALLYFT
jgi:hypothetical protein